MKTVLIILILIISNSVFADYTNPKKESAHQLARAYLAGQKSISTVQLKSTHPDTEENAEAQMTDWEFDIYNSEEDCYVLVDKNTLDVKTASCLQQK